jgi:hypothetical protein
MHLTVNTLLKRYIFGQPMTQHYNNTNIILHYFSVCSVLLHTMEHYIHLAQVHFDPTQYKNLLAKLKPYHLDIQGKIKTIRVLTD